MLLLHSTCPINRQHSMTICLSNIIYSSPSVSKSGRSQPLDKIIEMGPTHISTARKAWLWFCPEMQTTWSISKHALDRVPRPHTYNKTKLKIILKDLYGTMIELWIMNWKIEHHMMIHKFCFVLFCFKLGSNYIHILHVCILCQRTLRLSWQ